jgi:hypothetical protein
LTKVSVIDSPAVGSAVGVGVAVTVTVGVGDGVAVLVGDVGNTMTIGDGVGVGVGVGVGEATATGATTNALKGSRPTGPPYAAGIAVAFAAAAVLGAAVLAAGCAAWGTAVGSELGLFPVNRKYAATAATATTALAAITSRRRRLASGLPAALSPTGVDGWLIRLPSDSGTAWALERSARPAVWWS